MINNKHIQVKTTQSSLLSKLNTVWHEKALWIYGLIITFHMLEHVFQAFQVFVLHMPRPESGGLLGYIFPALVTSEALHFAYAVFTFGGLLLLYPAFGGRARSWWLIAIVFQSWHFLEHALLQGQVLFGVYLFGASGPIGIGQLLISRVELHLLYNTLVTLPTILGIYYHFYPPAKESQGQMPCTCSRRASTIID
jgi:hypothetical protein